MDNLASLTELLAIAPTARVTAVVAGELWSYDPADTGETDGATCFVPDALTTAYDAPADDVAGTGLETWRLRGDRGAPYRGTWQAGVLYAQGELVAYGGAYFWAMATHLSAAPPPTADWALPDDPWAASLVPYDYGLALPHQHIVWGSLRLNAGPVVVTDVELHGHTGAIFSNSPAVYPCLADGKYLNRRIMWHRAGRLRDSTYFGGWGGLASILRLHDTPSERVGLAYRYAVAPGRWRRVLAPGEPLRPHMIGCVPGVECGDRLAWLLDLAAAQERPVDLSGGPWVYRGTLVLPDGTRLIGPGRDKPCLRAADDHLRWADAWHVAHGVDPATVDEATESVVAVGGGIYRINTPGVRWFFDADLFTEGQARAWLVTNACATVQVPGTLFDGTTATWLEPAGWNRRLDAAWHMGRAQSGILHAQNARSMSIEGVQIDGALDVAGRVLTERDYSYFWSGGTNSPLSAVHRESPASCGLAIMLQGGRFIDPGLRIELNDVWIHDTVGSCLVTSEVGRAFSGRDVRLGNSLSGRVKYNASGTWANLELYGASRSSVHRAYDEKIDGYSYRWGDGDRVPAWPGNDGPINIMGTALPAVRPADLKASMHGIDVSGIDIDVTGSGFYAGIAWAGDGVRLSGKVRGATTPLMRKATPGQSSTVGSEVDIVAYKTTPTMTPVAEYGHGALVNSDVRLSVVDGAASPYPALPAAAPVGAPIAVALRGGPARRGASTWRVECESFVANVALIATCPLSEAVPTELAIEGGSFRNVTNHVVGWGASTGQMPLDVEAYGLAISMDGVGFRLFDPGDTGGADQNRRAFVGDRAVVDRLMRVARMRGCYTTNRGDEMMIDGSTRTWNVAKGDPLSTRPVFWSERAGTHTITAVGGETTVEFATGLLWSARLFLIEPANDVTAAAISYVKAIDNPVRASPIDPWLCVRFKAPLLAGQQISLRWSASVTS